MSLQNRFLVPIVGLCVLAAIPAYFGADYLVRQMTDRSTDDAIQSKLEEINAYQAQIERYCLSHAALFSQDPRVQSAFVLAHEGDISDPDDPKSQQARQQLQEVFAPIMAGFNKCMGDARYGLHFHLPTGRSLLRVWRSGQKSSDDISSFRKTVMDINSGNHTPLTGVEVGRGGFVIRGLAPVTASDGSHLGSVEMLSQYVPLVLAAKTDDTQDLGIYMNAELLEVANKLTDESDYPRIGNQFVLVATTNRAKLLKYVDIDDLNNGRDEQFRLEQDNELITLEPINDYAGNQIGVIAYTLDQSATVNQIATMRMVIGCTAVFFCLALALATKLIAGSISRPINKIVNSITQSSDQVNDAASQVASSSQQLAEGASTTASSLEETSSSLEEMSSMTRNNAAHAREANSISTSARQAAEASDITMAKLTSTMGAINDSSTEINKIIKVIEEIAFQTNLLALNAAVEAARAGEHGKGFAVVADEVRSLAQRAAQAAQETTKLIEASVENAREGAKVTQEVATALEMIGGDIGSISDMLGGIASASEEQARGVEDINAAIFQIDQVTQQNAASAEESSSAAEQLSAQSGQVRIAIHELAALIGVGNHQQSHQRRVAKPDWATKRLSKTDTATASPQHGPNEAGSVATEDWADSQF
jgi:methyl-accepting chemotaxis protein